MSSVFRATSLVVVLGAALAAAACGSGQASENGLTLETSSVERGSIEASVEATGTVEPIRIVEVKSLAGGEILNIPVELGDFVERDELLLQIDPREERNQLDQARADLEQAEAQLEVATSRLNRARALRDSGVVTADELETAVLEHANARSTAVKARTQVELATEQRQDATVRAPISGTVVEKQVEEGQIISAARDVTGGTTLMMMADLAEIQVRTLVDESDIGKVVPGLPAELTVEAYPDRTFRGEVLMVEPQATVEQNVTMFAVLTRIPNPEGLLRPGMNADVEIVLGERENVLTLPNSGVKTPDEARQLVNALGMDPSLLEQSPPSTDGSEAADTSEANAAEGSAGEASGSEDDDLPSAEQLRSMSSDERRELFTSLDAEQRRRLMERMREGGQARDRAREEGQARPGFVFIRTPDGLTLKPITLGLSSWEETEIIAGLSEGDTVVEVPLALVQQRELLERFRDRGGIPGMGG